MRAILRSYAGERIAEERLVDVADGHKFHLGPYQDTVGFPIGSNQDILEIELGSFKDIEVKTAKHKVLWEWIGEGWEGDFDDLDPEDEPLLRFSCFQAILPQYSTDGNGWEEVPDGSYCTRCPITTPRSSLLKFAGEILAALELPSPKRRLEELSWLCPEDDKEIK